MMSLLFVGIKSRGKSVFHQKYSDRKSKNERLQQTASEQPKSREKGKKYDLVGKILRTWQNEKSRLHYDG